MEKKTYVIDGVEYKLKEMLWGDFEKIGKLLPEFDLNRMTGIGSIVEQIFEKNMMHKLLRIVLEGAELLSEEGLKKTKATVILEVIKDFFTEEASSLISGISAFVNLQKPKEALSEKS